MQNSKHKIVVMETKLRSTDSHLDAQIAELFAIRRGGKESGLKDNLIK